MSQPQYLIILVDICGTCTRTGLCNRYLAAASHLLPPPSCHVGAVLQMRAVRCREVEVTQLLVMGLGFESRSDSTSPFPSGMAILGGYLSICLFTFCQTSSCVFSIFLIHPAQGLVHGRSLLNHCQTDK